MIFRILATSILLLSLFAPLRTPVAYAQSCPSGIDCADESGETRDTSGDVIRLPNPLPSSDPRVIIGLVIRTVLGIVGSIALAFFIYGGLAWMTSAGNADRVKAGRDTLIWAALGLIVILGSYTFVSFVFEAIPGA